MVTFKNRSSKKAVIISEEELKIQRLINEDKKIENIT